MDNSASLYLFNQIYFIIYTALFNWNKNLHKPKFRLKKQKQNWLLMERNWDNKIKFIYTNILLWRCKWHIKWWSFDSGTVGTRLLLERCSSDFSERRIGASRSEQQLNLRIGAPIWSLSNHSSFCSTWVGAIHDYLCQRQIVGA